METIIKENDVLICNNDKPLEGNEVGPPLKEGNEYPVVSLFKCPCGQDHINVGLVSEYNWVRCYSCERELPTSGGGEIHWCHPNRFTVK